MRSLEERSAGPWTARRAVDDPNVIGRANSPGNSETSARPCGCVVPESASPARAKRARAQRNHVFAADSSAARGTVTCSSSGPLARRVAANAKIEHLTKMQPRLVENEER